MENNPREMYREINTIRKGLQGKSQLMRDENGNLITGENELTAEWGRYFNELLNVNRDHVESESDIHTAELDIEEPTFGEVTCALGKLKNNKAAGNDSLPAELLKCGGATLTREIYRLVLAIWRKEVIPKGWQESIIIPIFKKGDKTNFNNYRGISLLPTCYKVLANVIQARLTPFAEDISGGLSGRISA